MTDTSCGFVALIGAPNAGKSTLINALVGSKVSVVSRKAQTTRTTVRGIVIEGAAQIIFVDTPGLFAPKRRLDRAMAASAWGAAADADVLALLIDARQELSGPAKSGRGASPDEPAPPLALSEQTETIVRALAESKTPKVLALNKIDLVDRPTLLALAEKLNAALKFEETFMISAATGDGLDQLRERLARMMAPGPWLYPEDQITDAPIRSLAAEITREKLFERLHDELPYQATVETDSWKELPDGSVRIEQTIFVSRESHKKIVIGEGGRTIKSIGTAARKEIAEANDGPVHLFLFVKVRANWLDDPERYRAMGLEFPKS
jgi:GTP-binding protein Era